MTGIITRRDGTRHLFRDDSGTFMGIIAWEYNNVYHRPRVSKWVKIPRGSSVELFDADNPPATVSYTPLLAPY
jgi:hypothetical protein